jgi:uncharacterized DUF497 family protein
MHNLCIYLIEMEFEWDADKAEANFRKHAVRFSESIPIFEDDYAITIPDEESDPYERRFVSIGMGAKGRVLVVVYGFRGGRTRIISARLAGPRERSQYEEKR